MQKYSADLGIHTRKIVLQFSNNVTFQNYALSSEEFDPHGRICGHYFRKWCPTVRPCVRHKTRYNANVKAPLQRAPCLKIMRGWWVI